MSLNLLLFLFFSPLDYLSVVQLGYELLRFMFSSTYVFNLTPSLKSKEVLSPYLVFDSLFFVWPSLCLLTFSSPVCTVSQKANNNKRIHGGTYTS